MKIRIGLALLLCLCAASGRAADCASTAALVPMPPWVGQGSGENASDIYGVGVASTRDVPLQDAIKAARQTAQAELANSIRVNVSSNVRQTASKVTTGDRSKVNSSFESVTESATSLTLRSVRNDGQWIDGKDCQVWVRVTVSKAEAERAQQLEMSVRLAADVDNQLKTAEDEKKPLAARRTAMGTAEALEKLVDPSLVPTFAPQVVRIRIDGLRTALGRLQKNQDAYGAILREHLSQYAQAAGETSAVQKKIYRGAALRTLQGLRGMAPDGMADLPLPFDAKGRASELYAGLGLDCLGAEAAGQGGNCAPAKLATERRRLYLIGRPVSVTCKVTIDNTAAAWGKACALLKEMFVNEGALIDQASDATPLKVTVSGKGAIRTRADPDTAATMYRFEGEVQTHVDGPEGIQLSDSYEGITGWNPVSRQMTQDILALNLARRFDEKLAKLWEK